MASLQGTHSLSQMDGDTHTETAFRSLTYLLVPKCMRKEGRRENMGHKD